MTEKTDLLEQLYRYGQSDYYPYHMPGHKRRRLGRLPEAFLEADITEIDGFDNLHDPKDILRDLQEHANALYRAKETFYLINGSTGGILSALSAALPEGGHLLMARGCHQSAYHAVYLRRLEVTYLASERVDGFSFDEAVTAQEVEAALAREAGIGAVLIVSPTYEGRIANVEAIARVVHKRGIPLIVDEAHGAHLGFAEGFAPGSCTQGADLVIHSVHKTLPAPTQTALLHVGGDLIDRALLQRFLHIYQSSSPSYVLMAGICDAMNVVEEQGEELFAAFYRRYRTLSEHLKSCRQLCFVPWRDVERGRQDVGKLVIAAGRSGISGKWIYDALREDYHLQCEMAAGDYCLAMFTLSDGQEAYDRMEQALFELDARLTGRQDPVTTMRSEEPLLPVTAYSLWKAWDMPWEMVELSEAVGRPVADFVKLYPPGIPLLVPGEVLTEELCGRIRNGLRDGLNLQGIVMRDGKYYIKSIVSESNII